MLGYDGAVMRRDVHLAMVTFWTSVPMFAVYLALSGPLRDLAWPVMVLWVVVVVSSAYLTPQAFPPVSGEGERSETQQTSEALVYPITLLLAFPLPAFQIF
jgi:preprotein translocase subunit SecF